MKQFRHDIELSEQQFIEKYRQSNLLSEAYLKVRYAWMHSQATWQQVVEAYATTEWCRIHHPDLYKKYNAMEHAP